MVLFPLRDGGGIVSAGYALRVLPGVQCFKTSPSGEWFRPGDVVPLGSGWRPEVYGSAILGRIIGGRELYELVRVGDAGAVVEVVA